MRVSAVLPKWMVGKLIWRDYAGLREKIRFTSAGFEVKWSPLSCPLLIAQMADLLDVHQTA